ncbi:MAG: glycosyltransferase [Rhodospirillales bacterium]|nr:glycosyltransferase [Rhodospirillales bacterium]
MAYSTGLFGSHEVSGARWRSAAWLGAVDAASDVLVRRAGKFDLHIPRIPVLDKFLRNRYLKSLRGLHEAPAGDVVIAFSPEFAPLVREFPDAPLIYYVEDAFNLMPGWSAENECQHRYLVERADLLLTCSEAMAREQPGNGPAKARILPNGVDFEFFAASEGCACPADMSSIPHPRIGYTGSVNLKVDFGLVAELAEARPNWHWVFVGRIFLVDAASKDDGHQHIRDAYQACRSLPNVHFLGQREYADVPAYERHMDVNMMCYRTDGEGWWKAIDPLKTHEYLAVGLPIVAADQASVREYADQIAIAYSPGQWLAEIEKALAGHGVGTTRSRLARARRNDWDTRVDLFEGWLADVVAKKSGLSEQVIFATSETPTPNPQQSASPSSRPTEPAFFR